MATDLTPRTAVITGAGSRRGIGRATAHALAAAGYHIAVLDLDKEAAEDTAREVAVRHGVETLGLPADVTDADAVEAAIGAVEAALPPVGALVNNAGITSPTRFLDVTPTEWDRILEVNVRGSFLVTHRVATGMAERGFGRIVFLSSVSAERGGGVFGGVAYSAAKAALLGFAKALARELGSSGVTVNSVAPGLIDTDITQGKLDEERKAAMIADVPVRRIGAVEDVADVIALLARPESGYLTGVTYDVNGGSHIH
ncbi:SDR family NAD(P)-dependent oxidoreductase [Streptomyces sp. NPDC001663]|uniref:SDR family NAD(P)-dependent oxidoreductase n=1 Tax=Streptomyces sp. NPDC001663 TaxID=3364597 RepID=UPI0036AD78D6